MHLPATRSLMNVHENGTEQSIYVCVYQFKLGARDLDLMLKPMKLHWIKVPFTTHYNHHWHYYVIPAAVLTTWLVVLAAVRLPGRMPLLVVPSPAVTSSRSTDGRGRTGGGNGSASSSCDIFKGEWVPDGAPPRYTSATCPVIHGHYDCARHGRPDLGFAGWRWRPDGSAACELPRFDAARFLAAMRGKAVAFVGDSLARNQLHSLVCLLAKVERPVPWNDRGSDASYGGVYRYERHDLTVAFFWSPFLVRAAETDGDGPAGLWSLHLDEPDAMWAGRAGEFDVVVVSAGSWFYRPSLFYERRRLVGCNGGSLARNNVTDLTLRYSLRAAFRSALRAAVLAPVPGPGAGRSHSRATRTVVVRTLSPSHYENGTWDGDGDCARTRPLRRGEWEMDAVQKEMHRIQVEEFAAVEAEAARGGGRVRMLLMDATEAMAMRPDAHPSKYRLWLPAEKLKVSRDCVHWCLPGAMDACNDMLLHMLLG